MKKKNKNLLLSEDAQSTVIGFVLIMGILIVASTSYFAYHIPDWTKAYESLHAADVTDDFSELKSLIDGIVLKQGESELAGGAAPVKMVPDKVPILGMSPPGSNLDFLPDNEIFKITPTVTGGATSPTIANFSWVESTTADFSNTTAKRVKVDVTLDRIELSKLSTHGDLIIDGTAAIRGGEYYYEQVKIINGGTLYVAPGEFLRIYASQITVESGSKIFADGRGFLGGDGGKLGCGMGYGNPGSNGSGGGGSGYGSNGGNGGIGGSSGVGSNGTGGASYGNDSSSSIEFGSGGGGGGYGEGGPGTPFVGANGGDGGNGGGAILLHAEKITIAGTISADGSIGRSGSDGGNAQGGGGGGGGSGGTILIRGRDVSLSGNLYAKGGPGGDGGDGGNAQGGGGGGGGAGGRIKVFYNNTLPEDYSYSVDGGTGGDGDEDKSGADGYPGSGGSFYENETTYSPSIPLYSAGYYESRVHDTGNTTTCYGNMTWSAAVSDDTSIVMKVRTSRSPIMDDVNATLWENCPAVANGQVISDLSSAFDGHRYIQYRAELSTYEATMTPELYSVRIYYSSADPGGGSPTVEEASGIIKFNSNYFYYPNQEIVYEHGALIKWQPEGGFMLHPPPINITNESGVPTIEISMVDLTGAECSYSGATTISVENIYKDYDSFNNKFDNLTLNLTTAYPSIWGKWFNNELEESGLGALDYNVSVNATAKTVSVEFYGHGDGVELYLEKTVIEVKI
ncbi:MAG: hypothetical protein WBC40_11565 [Halobacteriota archaeon]